MSTPTSPRAFTVDGLSPAALAPWAKTAPEDPSAWLSLAQHMVDSANVGRELWARWVAPSLRRRLADLVGLSEQDTAVLVAWLAGVHDIGKATLTFQTQLRRRRDGERDAFIERLTAAGLPLRMPAGERLLTSFPHGLASAAILSLWLEDEGAVPRIARSLVAVVDAHHGIASTSGARNTADSVIEDYPDAWIDVHDELLDHLATATEVRPVLHQMRTVLTADAQQLLTGLVIMADWIASDQSRFPLAPVLNPQERLAHGTDLDLTRPWSAEPVGMASLDNHLRQRFAWSPSYGARPVQRATAEACLAEDLPGLLIIEAPTGEGKTEAALLAAEILSARTGAGGLLVAAPTMATADGLFRRVLSWAEHATGEAVASMYLGHSKASLNVDYSQLRRRAEPGDTAAVHSVFDEATLPEEPSAGGVIASQWMSGRKKGVLSTFVVATVDQVLLMALQAKHSMLRHVGLAGKVIVIDEVHAYDAYMSEYLHCALAWLARYRVPVVLLSATLPLQQKTGLIEAYRSELLDRPLPDLGTSYPALTTVSSHGVSVEPVASRGADPRISVRIIDDHLPAVLEELATVTRDGGCVLIICNTVRRAQEMFRAVCKRWPGQAELHHAAFIASDRARKEESLRERLGPSARRGDGRPARLFVVATQVAEQSLDIDADLLVTDIAPMDLIIQRIGRLHRHPRPASDRPQAVRAPQVWVRGIEDLEHGILESGTRAIYDERTLLASLAILHDEMVPRGFTRPDDVPDLVQSAYAEDPPPLPPSWSGTWERAVTASAAARTRAQRRAATFRFPMPSRAESLEQLFTAQVLDADTSRGEARGLAQVRDSDPSIEVIPILQGELGYRPLPQVHELDAAIPSAAEVPRGVSRALAAATVRLPSRLSRPHVFDEVVTWLEQNTPVGWWEDLWLRGQLALPLSEGDRTVVLNGHHLEYDDAVGLHELAPDRLNTPGSTID